MEQRQNKREQVKNSTKQKKGKRGEKLPHPHKKEKYLICPEEEKKKNKEKRVQMNEAYYNYE